LLEGISEGEAMLTVPDENKPSYDAEVPDVPNIDDLLEQMELERLHRHRMAMPAGAAH